jgi:murein DD-endopeptidase MepM/ murein hydrolase activator NlpD
MLEKIKRFLFERINLSAVSPTSFQTIFGFEINRLTIISLIFVFFVLSAVATFFIISYTPLKGFVPSNTESYQKSELIEQQLFIDSLLAQIELQEQYTQDIKTVLSGGKSRLDKVPDSIPKVEKAENIIDTEMGEAERELVEKLQEDLNASGMVERQKNNNKSLFFFAPVKGVMSQKMSDNHPAVDIVAQKNAPVKSILDGKIIYADYSNANGYTVIIYHNSNFISAYKHLQSVNKKMGESVKVGEVIGIVGNTGENSSGPHLHFELINDGRFVDPTQFMSFK